MGVGTGVVENITVTIMQKILVHWYSELSTNLACFVCFYFAQLNGEATVGSVLPTALL